MESDNIHTLVLHLDEVKEKLTSQEYMTLMADVQKVRQQKEPNFGELFEKMYSTFRVVVEYKSECRALQVARFNKFVIEVCKHPEKHVKQRFDHTSNYADYHETIDYITKRCLFSKKLRARAEEIAKLLCETNEEFMRNLVTDPSFIQKQYRFTAD